MAAPGVLFLLLLLALAGTPSTGATRTLPPPSNLRHSIDVKRCQLNVLWDQPEPMINGNCSLTYASVVWQDDDTMLFDTERSRTVIVELGKEIVFGVRTECSSNDYGPWYNFTLQQRGMPGTGAVNINCIWHNEEYIRCLWKAGENATQNNYNLFYRYRDQPEVHQCTNSSRDGNNFQCTFIYTKSQGLTMLWILVKGASEDVQPMCVNGRDFPIKMHPPSICNVSKDSNGVILEWTVQAERRNLIYEIESKDTATNSVVIERSDDDKTRKPISLKPNARHTFRVRVKPKENVVSFWSDWSEEAVWDDRDNDNNIFYTLLYIFIPLCVAALTIIVLVYLKRIKLLILPKIPDPGQVLKKMFEDQSEDLQKHPTYDVMEDEKIHSLTLLECTGNEV